jgi:hypothetical protein
MISLPLPIRGDVTTCCDIGVHLINSFSGSPVQAFGYGTLHNDDNVAAISVILTFLVTEVRFTVQPYHIRGT